VVQANPISSGSHRIPFSTNTDIPGRLIADESNTRWFFLHTTSLLGQYYNKSSMYIQSEIDMEGSNLRDALNDIISSFLLVGIISNTKQVIIKRRIDDAGNPVTSGNSIALTNNNCEEITEENLYSRAVAWISVGNGNEGSTHSYDGTVWDGQYLGTGRKMELTLKHIPDNLIKDVAFYLFRFFRYDHIMYPIPLANVLPLQMECLDEVALTINSKIVKTATGIIYGVEQAEDSQMTLQVLV
jgi:hypothetical protein